MRIGINIPNELMKRLEPLKPELNISQVCREVLTSKAEKYEQMKASLDDEDIKAALETVGDVEAEFRAAVEVDWERLGYEDAAAWVKVASWDEWYDLLEDIDLCTEGNSPLWQVIFPADIEGVPDFFTRQGELHDRENEMAKKYPGFRRWILKNWQSYVPDRQAYMTAWLAYTDAVWELIRQRQLEYLNEQIAKLTPQPQPDVPKHILEDIQRGR